MKTKVPHCHPVLACGTIRSMRLFRRKGSEIWQVAVRRGVEISLKTTDRRVAEAVLKKMEREALEGRLFQLDKTARITLSQFLEEFMGNRQHLSSTTLTKDRAVFKLLGDVVGSDIPLKALTKAKLDEFVRVCIARGTKPVTVKGYQRHIKAMLNAAVSSGYMEKAPDCKLIKTPKSLPEILTPEQCAALVAYANSHDPSMSRIIRFALNTGCRREEIYDMRWEHVRRDEVRITGKGDRDRIIPLVKGALEAMGEGRHIGNIFPIDSLNTITNRFRRIRRACGLPETIHFHSLRHSAATQMLSKGVPLPMVQSILGHEAISTTQIYAQVMIKTLKEEMKKFNWGTES